MSGTFVIQPGTPASSPVLIDAQPTPVVGTLSANGLSGGLYIRGGNYTLLTGPGRIVGPQFGVAVIQSTVVAQHSLRDLVNSGTIAGLAGGVYVSGDATIHNNGIILGVQTTGTTARSVAIYVHDRAAIFNASNIVGNSGVVAHTGSLVNDGYIGATGVAVQFALGGIVTNHGNAVVQGMIATGDTGAVYNQGRIFGYRFASSAGQQYIALSLGDFSRFENSPVATFVQSGSVLGGVYLGVSSQVTNAGLIQVNQGPATQAAINAGAGSYILNAAGGRIQGNVSAIIDVDGSVNNAGTLSASATSGQQVLNATGSTRVTNSGLVTASGTGGIGVVLAGAGSLSNTGRVLAGGTNGIAVASVAGASIGNSGTILATGAGGIGAELVAGGSIGGSGTISASGAGGVGIELLAGGTIGILAGGRVGGAYAGVIAYGGQTTQATTSGATATIVNNPAVITNAGTIIGATGLFLLPTTDLGIQGGISLVRNGAVGTVTNSGLIQGTAGNGAVLAAGGRITNAASGTILATGAGVLGLAPPTTVANAGSIGVVGDAAIGIQLGGAGSLNNSGRITVDGRSAAGVVLLATPSFVNTGTIVATGANSLGVQLAAGGTVTTNAVTAGSGLISGAAAGVFATGGPALVTGFGTIVATQALSRFSYPNGGGTIFPGTAVDLEAGGTVNVGTILATGQGGTGVVLRGGGRVVVAANALIDADSTPTYTDAQGNIIGPSLSAGQVGYLLNLLGTGVYANGAATTIDNAGTIRAGKFGVVLANGGSLSTAIGSTIRTTGTLGVAVALTAGGTITQAGTVDGGIYVGGGAGTIRAAASILNTGLITGKAGITPGADHAGTLAPTLTIANQGTVRATGTSSGDAAIQLGGTAVLTNSRYVFGVVAGVLAAGPAARVDNAIGRITASATTGVGVGLSNDATLRNAGQIEAAGTSGVGVLIAHGGSVENTFKPAGYFNPVGGTITGGRAGIVAYGDSISQSDTVSIRNTGQQIVGFSGTTTLYAPITTGIIRGGAGVLVSRAVSYIGGNPPAQITHQAVRAATLVNSGLIEGTLSDGALLASIQTTVQNDGTIRGTAGLQLVGSGVTIGTASVMNTGAIIGTTSVGLFVANAVTATITNAAAGLIQGVSAGLVLENASLATPPTQTFVNAGTIRGTAADSKGLELGTAQRATITNAASGLIEGGAGGLSFNDASSGPGLNSFANQGTIRATGTAGIALYAAIASDLTNDGTIEALNGIALRTPAGGTLRNTGRIAGGSAGVSVGAGQAENSLSLINTGLVSATGPGGAAVVTRHGDIDNQATITGASVGILLSEGTVTNRAGALIQGNDYGLAFIGRYAYPGVPGNTATITNRGTITGGVGLVASPTTTVSLNGTLVTRNQVASVRLVNSGTIAGTASSPGTQALAASFGDVQTRIVLEAGGAFRGVVSATGPGNVIEATSGVTLGLSGLLGTLGGFGTITSTPGGDAWGFAGFQTLIADAGSRLTTTGVNIQGAGQTITALGAFTNYGSLVLGGVFSAAGSIANFGSIAGDLGVGAGQTLTNGVLVNGGTTLVGSIAGTVTGGTGAYIGNAGTLGGVVLQAGGTLRNGGTATPGATVLGNVVDRGGAAYVANLDTIAGSVTLGTGGTLVNAGSVAGTILLEGTNTVTLLANEHHAAIQATDPASNVLHLAATPAVGTLATNDGILSRFGLTVVDAGAAWKLTGTAPGTHALDVFGDLFTTGTLAAGLHLGALQGQTTPGVPIGTTAFAALVNSGDFQGVVTLGSNSQLINLTGGLFEGQITDAGGDRGIVFQYGNLFAPVFHYLGSGTAGIYGTFGSGSTIAIDMSHHGGTVVLGQSALVIGNILGNGTSSLLQLADAPSGSAAGTLSGVGVYIDGFNLIAQKPAASWVVAANDFGAGTTFASYGFVLSGDNTLEGRLVNSGTFAETGLLDARLGTLQNFGVMLNTGTIQGRVTLGNTGYLFNQVGGTILGDITAAGTGVNLVDAGAIQGNVTFGSTGGYLALLPGGTVTGTITSARVVTNGTTLGNTLDLGGNTTGTLTGLGRTITGFTGIRVETGAGWILGGGATIEAGATLTNLGQLLSYGAFENHGTLLGSLGLFQSTASNSSNGVILGRVVIADATTQFVNQGTLTGTVAAVADVVLNQGGVFTNTAGGVISGGLAGVYAAATTGQSATIVNAGTIGGTYGVYFNLGGSASGTLVNSGRITAAGTNAAVTFAGTQGQTILNRVVVQQGASFGGAVVGNASAFNTLEWNSTGALAGLGTRYAHFNDVVFDGAGTRTITGGALSGGAYAIRGGVTLGLGTLSVTNSLLHLYTSALTTGDIIVDGGTLELDNTIGAGVHITLLNGARLQIDDALDFHGSVVSTPGTASNVVDFRHAGDATIANGLLTGAAYVIAQGAGTLVATGTALGTSSIGLFSGGLAAVLPGNAVYVAAGATLGILGSGTMTALNGSGVVLGQTVPAGYPLAGLPIATLTLPNNNGIFGGTLLDIGTLVVSTGASPATYLFGATNQIDAIQVQSGAKLYLGGGLSHSTFALGTSLDVAAGGLITMAGTDKTVGSLSGTGNISVVGIRLTVDEGTNSNTFDGSISGTGTVVKQGLGTLTLGGLVTQPGLDIEAGRIVLASTGTLINQSLTIAQYATLHASVGLARFGDLSGGGLLQLGTNNITISVGAGTTNHLDVGITGTGTLTKTGAGLLQLADNRGVPLGRVEVAAGDFALGLNGFVSLYGGVDVSAGATLTALTGGLGIGSLSGAGTVVVGTYLVFDNAGANATFSGRVSGAGRLTKTHADTFTFSGTATNAGGFYLGYGELRLGADATIGGPVRFSGNADIDLEGHTLTFGGAYLGQQGPGSLRLDNGAVMIDTTGTAEIGVSLTGAGRVGVTGGTLLLDRAGNLGTATVTVGSLGTLALGYFDQSFATLANSGTVLTTYGHRLGLNGTTTLGGTIAGTGGVSIGSAGRVILNGANAFTGGLLVNGGRLSVANDAALGGANGGVTLQNGATLNSYFSFDSGRTVVVAGQDTFELIQSHLSVYAISGAGGFSITGGGTLTVSGRGSPADGTIGNATLELAHPEYGSGQKLTFATTGASGGHLVLDGARGTPALISRFAVGDTIDFRDIHAAGTTGSLNGQVFSFAATNVFTGLDGNANTLTGPGTVSLTLANGALLSADQFVLADDGAGGTMITLQRLAAQTSFTVTHLNGAASDMTALNSVLASIASGPAGAGRNGADATNYTITLGGTLAGGTLSLDTDLQGIELGTGSTLVIDGQGAIIDGGNAHRGFFAFSGDTTIQNLTLQHLRAQGGAGGSGQGGGGGGGAGLGGGLFIGTGAGVSLSHVSFLDNSAVGGRGGLYVPTTIGPINNNIYGAGAGGGGGLGGAGGYGAQFANGHYGNAGGGGIGAAATGGSYQPSTGVTTAPGTGILFGEYGSAGGGTAGQPGGAAGSFGGGGKGGGASGIGGSGGFGGGGGAGGGNGALNVNNQRLGQGGAGGFGGGGGANGFSVIPRNGGAAGYGAGRGAAGLGGGGGGFGAGGDIFIQDGGHLSIGAGTLLGGTATGGTASQGASTGRSNGNGIFLQDASRTGPGQVITFNPGPGETLLFRDLLANTYQNSNDTLLVTGGGTVVFSPSVTLPQFANAYTYKFGGTKIVRNATLAFDANQLPLNPLILAGGTLQARGDDSFSSSVTLLSDTDPLPGGGTVPTTPHGSDTIDTGGYKLTFTSTVAGVARLDIIGGGTVTLAPFFTSLTDVLSGGVQIGAGTTLALGGSRISGGGEGGGLSPINRSVASAITFNGVNATLRLAEGVQLNTSTSITSLANGNRFDLVGFTGATQGSFSPDGHILTFTDGARTTSFTITNATAGQDFLFAQDSDGSGEFATVACFVAGTRIRAERGDTPVEHLQIGDRVATLDGALKPVRWIGRRAYPAAALHAHDELRPIRIRAGTLAAGIPHRDLLVSPMHAMLLHGVLIPAADLVDGHAIIRDDQPGPVDYLHIELATHDVIWAEGAPTETFIDEQSRQIFDNAAEFQALDPDASTTTPCAPRLRNGPLVEAARNAIAARKTPSPIGRGPG